MALHVPRYMSCVPRLSRVQTLLSKISPCGLNQEAQSTTSVQMLGARATVYTLGLHIPSTVL